MVLKFKDPEIKQSRLKILVFGGAGTGKSTMCTAFPNVAFIDTEDTTSKPKYQNALRENRGQVMRPTGLDEIIEQLEALLTTKHDFKTVAIDSLTVPYTRYKDLMETEVGSDYGRNTALADKKVKIIIDLLLRLDMNVIITCHSKEKYTGKMHLDGFIHDGYKRLDYMFDIVLEAKKLGTYYTAFVHKSRLDGFVGGEEFNFSYDEVVRRCGLEIVQKEAVPELLATDEQVASIKNLISILSYPSIEIDKWLAKANCDNFEHMPFDAIHKCINFLEKKLKQEL